VVSGTVNNVTISSGGRVDVAGFSGVGRASGMVVSSGGTLDIWNFGVLSGATLSGGLIEIQGGGSADEIDFSSTGGTLQLDDSKHFSGVISGFGVPGGIDLRDIAFNSATTTLGYSGDASSGILSVSDGVHSANIHLLGQYTAGNFTLQADGNGGTLVTDPPLGSVSSVTSPHG
jgi:hypothetical protein